MDCKVCPIANLIASSVIYNSFLFQYFMKENYIKLQNKVCTIRI